VGWQSLRLLFHSIKVQPHSGKVDTSLEEQLQGMPLIQRHISSKCIFEFLLNVVIWLCVMYHNPQLL